jgi:copper chaperone CopZ
MKIEKKLIGVGLLSATAASLCCITPILAALAGASGLASYFSWSEPLRPYFIGFSILALGYAWYQKLKPGKQNACGCDSEASPKLIQSKMLLALVTAFTVVMLAFPYYSSVFYSKIEKSIIEIDKSRIRKVEFAISGMTCVSCQKHINRQIHQLPGIINANVSYQNENAIVEFDHFQTNIAEIEKAINAAGYSITNKKEN